MVFLMLLSAKITPISGCERVTFSSLTSFQILTFEHCLDMYSWIFNGEKLRGVSFFTFLIYHRMFVWFLFVNTEPWFLGCCRRCIKCFFPSVTTAQKQEQS